MQAINTMPISSYVVELKVETITRFSKFLRVYCDNGYLIPSCEEHCSSTNNLIGHYDCDFVNGKKQCQDGWHGDNCSNYCLPRNDDLGHYTCDNRTGNIVCLPGWKNKGANCTDGKMCLMKFYLTSDVTVLQ